MWEPFYSYTLDRVLREMNTIGRRRERGRTTKHPIKRMSVIKDKKRYARTHVHIQLYVSMLENTEYSRNEFIERNPV